MGRVQLSPKIAQNAAQGLAGCVIDGGSAAGKQNPALRRGCEGLASDQRLPGFSRFWASCAAWMAINTCWFRAALFLLPSSGRRFSACAPENMR